MKDIVFVDVYYCYYWIQQTVTSVELTTSVMLRIFLVMVSLSWAGVGVNHNFWNVSFTNFYE